MTYKKISIKEVTEQLTFADWDLVKNEINNRSGFYKFVGPNDLAYAEQNRTFSFDNFYNAEFLIIKESGLRVDSGEFKIIKKKISSGLNRLYLEHECKTYSISNCNAHLKCPECDSIYVIDGNPARNYKISTSICGKCQKKWLHKFDSYQKNYVSSMLKKYGVERPLQKKEILEKACNTRMELYGAAYPMQREEVKKKHAEGMLRKWGRANYFSGLNSWEEFGTFKEKGFISKFEKSLATLCTEIFGEQSQTSLSKKSKFKDEDGKYYSPDFYDPQREIIIEFNGDFFHANPEMYDDRKIFNSGMTFEEVREREHNRFQKLKTFCKNVYVIWEKDWKNNPEKVTQILLEIKNANDQGTFISREKLLGWQPQLRHW